MSNIEEIDRIMTGLEKGYKKVRGRYEKEVFIPREEELKKYKIEHKKPFFPWGRKAKEYWLGEKAIWKKFENHSVAKELENWERIINKNFPRYAGDSCASDGGFCSIG